VAEQLLTHTPEQRRLDGGKFLTFSLADEAYGVEILKVREIIGLPPITRVPRLPAFMRGVVNVRGKVVPVVDLRMKFGMEAIAYTPLTCIVIVRVESIEVGIIVDRVVDVLTLRPEEIGAPPSFGSGLDPEFLLGIGTGSGRVTLLLDIDRVLSAQDAIDLRAVDAVGEPA
jgi:purine-binding chemotaxis protein CheW